MGNIALHQVVKGWDQKEENNIKFDNPLESFIGDKAECRTCKQQIRIMFYVACDLNLMFKSECLHWKWSTYFEDVYPMDFHPIQYGSR